MMEHGDGEWGEMSERIDEEIDGQQLTAMTKERDELLVRHANQKKSIESYQQEIARLRQEIERLHDEAAGEAGG